MSEVENTRELKLAASIVSAYVGKHSVPVVELPTLIADVYSSLKRLQAEEEIPEPLVPAVPVSKSVTPDYIISLEDGRRFKSLKRHLGAQYGMTPEQYRARWNLPATYPMVAPNYAAARSELAKNIGLGKDRSVDTGADQPMRRKG